MVILSHPDAAIPLLFPIADDLNVEGRRGQGTPQNGMERIHRTSGHLTKFDYATLRLLPFGRSRRVTTTTTTMDALCERLCFSQQRTFSHVDLNVKVTFRNELLIQWLIGRFPRFSDPGSPSPGFECEICVAESDLRGESVFSSESSPFDSIDIRHSLRLVGVLYAKNAMSTGMIYNCPPAQSSPLLDGCCYKNCPVS